MTKPYKICFVISALGPPGSKTRKRSERIYKHIIEPAVKKCGYKTVRADMVSEPGDVPKQIIHYLEEAPMVVADLTGYDPNVLYELGYRQATMKPLVQLIEIGQSVPFSLSSFSIIYVDLHTDKIKGNIIELAKEIKAAEKQTGAKIKILPLLPAEKEIYDSAITLKEDGAYRDALKKLDRLTVLRPDFANAYIMKGRIFLEKLKQYHRVLEEFKKALRIYPYNTYAQYDLALTYYHLGYLQQAIIWNKKALYQNPEFIIAMYNQAIFYAEYAVKYKKPVYFDGAVRLYQKVIERNKEYAVSAMFNLAALYSRLARNERKQKSKKRYIKDAIKLLDTAIEREGVERLEKVTGDIHVPYGDDLKEIWDHPAYKKMIAKWKRYFTIS